MARIFRPGGRKLNICSKSILFAIFCFFALTPASFARKADFEYRKGESVSWQADKQWRFFLEEEMWFRDDANDFYLQYTELGVIYSGVAGWLEAGVSFRHLETKGSSGWKREERPNLISIVKFKPAGWDFSNRFKFEYRIREDADDFWRYRNNLTVRLPWKFTRLEIRPYLSDEFFVDFDSKEINENRLQPGFSLKLAKYLSADIYFMWRRRESGGVWLSQNIVGTRIKLSF